MVRFLIICLIALVLASCGHKAANEAMDTAEALIDSIPGRSIEILDSIRPGLPRARSIRARHALLSAHAAYKAWQPLPNDSLLELAATYYSGAGSNYYRFLAQYYKAISDQEKGLYMEASAHLIKAEIELKPLLPNPYLEGLLNRQIADGYENRLIYGEASSRRKRAAELFREAGKNDFYLYEITNLALTLNASNKPNEALNFLNQITNNSICNDSILVGSAWEIKIDSYRRLNMTDSALYALRQANRFWNPDLYGLRDNTIIARVYLNANETDSAGIMLSKIKCAETPVSEAFHRTNALYLYKIGLQDSAFLELNKSYNIYNDTIAHVLSNDISFVERDVYRQISQTEQLRSKNLVLLVISITLFGIVIICLLIYFFRIRNIILRAEIDRQVNEICRISSDLDRVTQHKTEIMENLNQSLAKIAALEESIEKEKQQSKNNANNYLLLSYLTSLNNLFEDFYNLGRSKKLQGQYIKKTEEELRRLRSDAVIGKIVDYINITNQNFIDKIRLAIPKIKQDNIRLLCLLKAGFTPKAICTLLDIKVSSYYAKVNRLRKRLAKVNLDSRLTHNKRPSNS